MMSVSVSINWLVFPKVMILITVIPLLLKVVLSNRKSKWYLLTLRFHLRKMALSNTVTTFLLKRCVNFIIYTSKYGIVFGPYFPVFGLNA